MAYLGVHVCTSKTQNIYFDTGFVETVLDTGCSVTLSNTQVILSRTNQVLEKYIR